MKKKVFGITLLLTIFTFGFAHGEELIIENDNTVDVENQVEEFVLADEAEELDEQEFIEDNEEFVEVEEIEELQEEVEEIIEEVEEILEEHEEIMDNEELDEAMEEAIELEEYDANKFEKIEDYYNKGKEKAKVVTNVVENQYNMKKQFVVNTKEVYIVTQDIKYGLKDITYEMAHIIKDEDRKIDKETYGEIRDTTKTLKEEVKENRYMVVNVARETVNYVVQVKNREIRNAAKTFENILVLQEKQLATLYGINNNVIEVKEILQAA